MNLSMLGGRHVIFLIAFFIVSPQSASSLRAQGHDASARFPDAAKVAGDFPDRTQRAAAFYVLSEALAEAAPKPLSRADSALLLKYQGMSNSIIATVMMGEGNQSPAYREFNSRYNQLTNDAHFVQALLDKYRLNGLPTYATPAVDESKYDVLTQLSRAFPWMLAGGIVPMVLAAWLVLRGSGIGRKIYPVRPPVAGGLPALPPALQVVSLPGVRYATYVLSGRVLDVQTSSHTSSHTTTTGGDVYHSSTGQIHTTPAQSWTTTKTTKETVIWVRSPDNREASWSLFNSNFQCRAGQLISILVRPLKTGEGEILLAYNHTAGTLEKCEALKQSHSPRGNELGQWAANIAGAYVAWKVFDRFLPAYSGKSIDLGFIVGWLAVTLVLVTISFLILTPLVKSFILRRRDASFNARYLPGFRHFFDQGTPILQRKFKAY